MNSVLLAVIAGLICMLSWGTSDFFAKKSVDKVGHAASIFWMQLLGVVPLLFFLILRGSWPLVTPKTILFVAFFAAIDAAGYLMLYKAFEKGKVSIVGPLVASYSAFSVIVSWLFLGERLNLSTIILLTLIFIGIILVSTDMKELRKNGISKKDFTKGVPEALLSVALLSFWFPFWDKFIADKDWMMMVLIIRVIMSGMLFLYAKGLKEALKINKTVFTWLAIVGLLDVIAYLFLTWGYSATTNTSIIIMLSSTFSIPTLILARIFLNERIKIEQAVGIAIILSGIAALAFI